MEPQRIKLTEDGSSWLDVYRLPKELLPTKEELDAMWKLHPEDKGQVKIMGNVVATPRWHQSYMRPYKFSGVQHEALPLPDIVKRYLDHANSSKYPSLVADRPFNMCLINWYENGNHYIGFHSDDESEAVRTTDGQSLVFSISFGQSRIFRLKPRADRPDHFSKDVDMPHGTVVVMGGRCQSTHKHAVPKVAGAKGQMMGKRINLTFRQFKDDPVGISAKRKRDDTNEAQEAKRQKVNVETK